MLSRLDSASLACAGLRDRPTRWRWRAALGVTVAVVLAVEMMRHLVGFGSSTTPADCGKRDSWKPPQVEQASNQFLYKPMSDRAAAVCVKPTPEAIPANIEANNYVPSHREIQAYLSARNDDGESPAEYSYYAKFVTGRPGLVNPTTDELIQWGSHKWGIPTDWVRAQYTQESQWRQDAMGDLRTQSPAWYTRFPRFSCPNSRQCYESIGISQIKWQPWNDEGTEPLRWKSTAFSIDYQAAKLRFYYDNPYGKRSAWGDSSYRPLDEWLSICGWFQPYPWGNTAQRNYCSQVKEHFAARDWPR